MTATASKDLLNKILYKLNVESDIAKADLIWAVRHAIVMTDKVAELQEDVKLGDIYNDFRPEVSD